MDGGDENNGFGAPGESGAVPARHAGMGHLDLERNGRKAQSSVEEQQWSAHDQQQWSVAPVTPQATPQHQTCQNHQSADAVSHVSKKQALGATTPWSPMKAAGEIEEHSTPRDLPEQQCLWRRLTQSETSEYRRVVSIRMM